LIHLVTAGIEQALEPLAKKFGVALHAVPLRFDSTGDYQDFDRQSLLARPRGKETVVRDIRARTKGKAAFVGGWTQRSEANRRSIYSSGSGGVHTRARVRDNADVFVAVAAGCGVATSVNEALKTIAGSSTPDRRGCVGDSARDDAAAESDTAAPSSKSFFQKSSPI